MFLKTLKNNDLASYFLLGVLISFFVFRVFSAEVHFNENTFLDIHSLFFFTKTITKTLFVVLWFLCFYWVQRIAKNYKLIETKGYVLLFLFVLFSFSFWSISVNSNVIASILFLLFCADQLFAIQLSQGNLYQSLNLGVLFGCAIFFYFPLLLLLPWLIISLSIVKSFQWRDLFLPLIGACLPFYLYSVWQFFNNKSNVLLTQKLFTFQLPQISSNVWKKELLAVFALVVLFFSLVYVYRVMDKMTVKIRMFYSVLIWMTLFLVVLIFTSDFDVYKLSFFLIPLSYLSVSFINNIKKGWIFDLALVLYFFLMFY